MKIVLNAVLLRPPGRWERILLVLILLGFVGFGWLVETRSAFLRRRMGDVGVYFRAAWAVRTGGQHLYSITDDNGWHYHYPPLFAVLLSPLADPPRRDLVHTASTAVGVSATPGPAAPLLGVAALAACPAPLEPDLPGTVPFAVSVALFYAGNLICLALAVHVLAGALERRSSLPGVDSVSFRTRRWWWLRLLPIFLCLPPIGHTLVRGQVNLIVLLGVCGLLASLLQGQRYRAGLYLSAAICLKLFPAYLLVVPLWRRDLRTLAGCALGGVIGLALIPALVMGPRATWHCYEEQVKVLVRPAFNLGKDTSRARELIEMTATDNQSFQAILHTLLHPDRTTRPDKASPGVRLAHWLLAGLLTLAILTVRSRSAPAPLGEPLFLGSLVLLMVLISPVSHLHYFTLALPLVMTLVAVALETDRVDRAWWGLVGLFVLFIVTNILPLLPGLEPLRDVGIASFAAGLLIARACSTLSRLRPPALPSPTPRLAA
jgi:hypothetical protein